MKRKARHKASPTRRVLQKAPSSARRNSRPAPPAHRTSATRKRGKTHRLSAEERAEERRQASLRLAHELAADMRTMALREVSTWIMHELSQPLMAILANAQASIRLLEPSTPGYSELRRSLEEIAVCDLRASQVLRRLRRLLHTRDLEWMRIDLNQLIAELADHMRYSGQLDAVKMQLALNTNVPAIAGDARGIRQVFLHLALNAVQAMQKVPEHERTLAIETAPHDPSTVRVSIHATASDLPERSRSGTFDAFVSSAEGAPGLDLRIAQSIVTAHGGRIWAEAHAAHGTAFHLIFPVAAP